MNTIPAQAQAQLKAGIIGSVEAVIRDHAGGVLSLIRSRQDHPSYGTTKTAIRERAAQMEGQIGLLMVLDGQAAHANVSLLATFADPATTDLVTRARRAVDLL